MCQYAKRSMLFVLLLQFVCLAAETEVQVLKGTVRAVTPTEQVDISVGQKGVLGEGQKSIVTVNDPLVQQVIEMYRWVQEEQQAGLHPIDAVHVAVQSLDEEDVWQYAALAEWTNDSSQPLNVITVGPMTTMDNLKFYDMEGNLLTYEAHQEGTRESAYTIHFRRMIEPNQQICYVASSKNYNRAHWQSKGPVWNINFGWGAGPVHRLQYTRIILPKSAILLSAYPSFMTTDKVDDRIALTFRDYGKTTLLAMQQVTFLWPDKDGTSLRDVPPRIRGLADPGELQLAQAYRLGLDSILAGKRITDTSTPMNSMLTLMSFAAHDLDNLDALWDSAPFLKTAFGNDLARAKAELTQNRDFLYIVDYYSGGTVPEDAKEGTIVSIMLKLKGTIAPYAKLEFMKSGEQWMPVSIAQI